MKLSTAIVRRPCFNIIRGLSTSNLGKPDYDLALVQHDQYIEALKSNGVEVIILPADNNYPDSTFIEDVAILTPNCAIIANPAEPSRKGEIKEIPSILGKFYSNVEYIYSPGTLEGGDVLRAGFHYYVGISRRTNQSGAQQLIKILEKYKMPSSLIEIGDILHLKSIMAYLDNNNLIVAKNHAKHEELRKFNLIKINEAESYAANCILINGKVIMAAGFPQANKVIRDVGYQTVELDLSEFRKIDGGASCLSLRF